ncbi:hypothetical protein niasHT_006896 [Heterodera trifolii]|uniref:RNA helicase n=1 Tax=Heterodera trifolii TaxID=157864 RepID=A0ABD2LMW1_9BILA
MFLRSIRRRSSNQQNAPQLPNFNGPNPFTGRPFSAKYRELYEERMGLPIWQHKTAFFAALEKYQCILLEAETGSGKTTQVPQWCMEWLRRKQLQSMVCCTQPRRLATVNVAQRVADEMDVPLGKEVGYSVRFEEAVSPGTLIKYCTDGVLLAEMSSRDTKLERYGVILLDEVHERTMTTDVVMGLIKRIMRQRKDLRVVVMSASLKTGKFARYFSGCQDPEVFIERAVSKAIAIHKKDEPGDILIFFTGQEDVEIGCEMLEDEAKKCGAGRELIVFPLYGSMQHDQYKLIKNTPFTANSPRRCIVATNVAETSLTIENLAFVIDPGFCKRKIYDPHKKLDMLLIQRVSRASALQRAGRAGRTRAGHCFRLYTEHNFTKMMEDVAPEIKHANLDSVTLRLKKCGVDDIHGFDLMDVPSREHIEHSLILLAQLGAIDRRGHITPLGEKIHRLPVDPPLARMMLESVKLHCSAEVISICAMLSAPNSCFVRPRKKQFEADQAKAKFIDDTGDHLTLLRVFKAFINNGRSKKWCHDNFLNFITLKYADDVYVQLMNVMHRLNFELISLDPSSPLYPTNILKALLSGTFMKLAFFCADSISVINEYAQRGFYLTMESQLNSRKRNIICTANSFSIHPSSVLFTSKLYVLSPPQWVLFNVAIKHREGGRKYLQTVSNVQPEWLAQLAPTYRAHISAKSAELDKMLREHEPRDTLADKIRALKLRLYPKN